MRINLIPDCKRVARYSRSEQIGVCAGADQVQVIPIHPVDQQPVRLDVAIAEVVSLAA